MKTLFIACVLLLPTAQSSQSVPAVTHTYVGYSDTETRPALLLTPPPMRILESAPVASLRPAVRLNPPTPPPVPPVVQDPVGLHGMPFAPPGLSNCEEMTYYRIQAGLPARFDALGWRESNCRNEPGIKTFCCYGYWQIYYSQHAGKLAFWCEVGSLWDINGDEPLDKQRQACSAKVLFDESGYQPWSTG